MEIDCDDAHLGAQLKELFDQGHDEVEIRHPIDGPIVITREQFNNHIKELERWKSMSPADKMMERSKLKRLKEMKKAEFVAEMATAKSYVIDLEGEGNFGKDINGEAIPIKGTTMVRTDAYPDGVELLTGEICCFIDEKNQRPPIRIVAKTVH